MRLEEEFAGAQLGDERLNKRLVELAQCFEAKHGRSILFSCADWKTSKSAYRFFDNGRFSETDILAPHIRATAARVNSLREKVLVVHDTTECNYTHHHATEGLGYLTTGHISSGKEQLLTYGFLMHASMALTQDGVPLGLLYQKQWCRDFEKFKSIRRSGKNFTRVPIEEKESFKWIEGIQQACDQQDPDHLVHICDRDADVYELFAHCLSSSTHFVVRAVHSRSTVRKGVKSFSKLSKVPAQGQYTLHLQASQKRPARQATLIVKFYKVTLVPPLAKAGQYNPVEVYVVSAKEKTSNHGAEKDRVNWKLLTDLPVATFDQALTIIRWYQARWTIEDYFKILKSGFGLEKSRLRHAERIKKFGALVSVLAWRVLWLTKVSRACPRGHPTLCFTAEELKALQAIEKQHGRTLSPSSAPLNACILALARLGGYLARKSDPPPGPTVMWRALQRLHDIMLLQEQ